MADNTAQNGTDTIATDDLATLNGAGVSGVKVQREKVVYGSDSDARDVDLTHGLPVQAGQSTAGTITAPNVSNTSGVALASNTARKGAAFFNGTNVDVLLSVSSAATTVTSYTIRILAGGYYELPGDNVVYTGALTQLGVAPSTLTATAQTSGTLTVTELT